MTDLETLLARRAHLTAERDTLTAIIADLDAEIMRGRAAGDVLTIDGQPVYRIAQQHRFSARRAAEVLTPAQVAACSVMRLDARRAADVLPADLLESCKTPTAPWLEAIK